MNMSRALRLIGRYSADQWGLVTSRQARLLGVDGVDLHRLTAAALIHPVRRGVHALSSSQSHEGRDAQAVWLALRPEVAGWERPLLDPDGAVVSHQSALRLHGLGDLAHTRVELSTPRRRTSRDPNVRFHLSRLTDEDVTAIDGLPVTTVQRTVCDLLDQHIDGSHIATVLRQAIGTGQLHTHELAEHLAPYARRYGVRTRDGQALLEHLLGHDTSPLTLAALKNDGAGWEELAGRPVTWGELAQLTNDPALIRLLLDRRVS